MSRGPGRIERAIRNALIASSSVTFTVEELASVAYPGVNRIEKKNRVAVLRAAYKVAADLGWRSRLAEQPGHPVVFFNPFDVHSYAMGWLRADFLNWRVPLETLERRLSEPNEHQSRWEWVQPGGAWWQHVEIAKADRDGNHGEAAAMADALNASVTAKLAVMKPISGRRRAE